jgi:hypothetical protein
MRALGYARTWPTLCFINGGCGEAVFAHTNGFGDFVLFDRLGWPWPIHECYLIRFCQQLGSRANNYEIKADALLEYQRAEDKSPQPAVRRTTRDIRGMLPIEHVGQPDKLIFGYILDYVENRVERLLRDLGTLGQQHVRSVLGNNRSQVTIITSDFESYTAFADLRDVVVRRKDMVAARIRAVRIVAVPDRDSVFLCSDLLLVRGSPSS